MSYNKDDKTYNGYIYLITNNINNMKYVGLTSTTVEKRWKRHLNITKWRAEKDFCLIDIKIKEYGSSNFNVETLAQITSNTEKELWNNMNCLEKHYINIYDSLWNNGCGKGYNIDEGGNSGTINYKPVVAYNINGDYIATFKSRLEAADYFNISDGTIIDICKGRKASYKSKYVFRDVDDSFDKYDITKHSMYRNYYQFSLDGQLIGNYHSCQEIPYDYRWRIYEVVDNPNKTAGNFWWSTKNNFNYKGNSTYRAIDVYDDSGNLLQNYKSINECSRILNINVTCIQDCCNGRQLMAGGYVFRYVNEPFNKYRITPKKSSLIRQVNQYSLEGIYIKTYKSLADACRENNAKTMSAINGCCLHRKGSKTAYGYKWFYTDDITQPDKSKIILSTDSQ